MKELNSQKIQKNLRNKFFKLGVKMMGPETIFFSKDTRIGKNVIIEPYVIFGLKVKIGNNVTIKSFSHLESCRIENNVDIGPYARIRPGTILKEGSRVGNFVEVKKSVLGKKSKVRRTLRSTTRLRWHTWDDDDDDDDGDDDDDDDDDDVCARVCACARVRACACACARVCVCVCEIMDDVFVCARARACVWVCCFDGVHAFTYMHGHQRLV